MANPEVHPALREWLTYADGMTARLQAAYSELQHARSQNEWIRRAVSADLKAKVGSVIAAAKKEGERVLLGARQHAQASLAAAREEAGETIAAARREASALVAAARQETARLQLEAERMRQEEDETLGGIRTTAEGLLHALSSVRQNLLPELTAMRERLEGIGKQLEGTVRDPLSDQREAPTPGLSEASALPWEPHLDAAFAAFGAGVSGGYAAYEQPDIPAPSSHASGDGTSCDPPLLESIDQRLIDSLWAES
jgi:cell division septum initiation protein DivIVA